MRDWGTYRKLYEVLNPDFERLPYAARCVAAEILRRCDRNGRIVPANQLTQKLVADVAFLVRAHTGEEAFLLHALEVLLGDGYFVFSSGYLTVRNFIDAQRSDSAIRMARHRARGGDETETAEIAEEDARQSGMQEVTEPHLPDTEIGDVPASRDAQAPPSFGLVSSGLVSSGSSPDPKKPKASHNPAGKRTRDVPAELGPTWMPTESQIAALAQKHGVEPLRIQQVVPEFRWYWREGDGQGSRKTLRGWAQAFANRIEMLAKKGVLYVEQAPPRSGSGRFQQPKQPNSGWTPRVENGK